MRARLPFEPPLLDEAPVRLESGGVPRQGPEILEPGLVLLEPEHILPAGTDVYHDMHVVDLMILGAIAGVGIGRAVTLATGLENDGFAGLERAQSRQFQ